MRDPIAHLTMLHRQYGLISAWEPRKPMHVFAFGPEWNQRILGQPDLFISDPFREVPVRPDSSMARLRSGLLGRNGDSHRQHRILMQTAFSANRVLSYHRVMVAAVERELDRWRIGEQRDLAKAMHRLTLDIAMRTMFGLDDPASMDTLQSLVSRLLAQAGSLTTMLIPFALPGTSYRSSMRTAEKIERFLKTVIVHKSANPADQDDILAALIAARNATAGTITDSELIGEAYTVFCHETSANALTWTWFLLAQHSRVLADVMDELDAELAGEPPLPDKIPRLQLLDRVIKESLRLLSPAFFGSRYTTASCEFGPFTLAKDATVFFSQYISHRLPEFFPHPLKFRPERWEGFTPSRYEYFPFGAGVHGCIAATFALMEMKIVLAMLLQRFHVRLVPGTRIDRAVRISLVPRFGMPVAVCHRDRQFTSQGFEGNLHEMVDFR